MHPKLRNLLKIILRSLAIATLKKFQPEIVGVTGTAGKTSTKNAIFSVLSPHWRVRATRANYNTEIGLPMTILGGWPKPGGAGFWIWVIISSAFRLVLPKFLLKYPQILVLEYGADRPGDIKRLLEIAKPRLGVITAIGDIPVHVEFYDDIEGVIREKGRLIEALPASGSAAFNADDLQTKKIEIKTRAKSLTFGFSTEADVRITRFETKLGPNNRPEGISFKLEYKDTIIPVRISGTLGRPQAYAAAAAATVGIMHNLNLVQISEALSDFKPPKHRLSVLKGIRQSYVIDDSYNSSPIAATSALETLSEIPAKRKIAILGDMRELGNYSKTAHEKLGNQAAGICDILITIGTKSQTTRQCAILNGLDETKTLHFENIAMAKGQLAPLIKAGDLVLIKGSLSIGLKAAVEELKALNYETLVHSTNV